MTLKLLLTILHRRRDQEIYNFNSRTLTLVQDYNFHLYVLGEGTVNELFKKIPQKIYNQDKTKFAMVENTEPFWYSVASYYILCGKTGKSCTVEFQSVIKKISTKSHTKNKLGRLCGNNKKKPEEEI